MRRFRLSKSEINSSMTAATGTGEQGSEKASKRIAPDERHDDQERRNADYFFHNERINEIGFKLIYDDKKGRE